MQKVMVIDETGGRGLWADDLPAARAQIAAWEAEGRSCFIASRDAHDLSRDMVDAATAECERLRQQLAAIEAFAGGAEPITRDNPAWSRALAETQTCLAEAQLALTTVADLREELRRLQTENAEGLEAKAALDRLQAEVVEVGKAREASLREEVRNLEAENARLNALLSESQTHDTPTTTEAGAPDTPATQKDAPPAGDAPAGAAAAAPEAAQS